MSQISRKIGLIILSVLLALSLSVGAAVPALAESGTETPICTDPSGQWEPDISGNRIVWTDMRNFESGGWWDVYMYDLQTNEETPICVRETRKREPAIDGDIIVWWEWDYGDEGYNAIIMYDLATGTETPIATWAVDHPAISGNRIIWRDNRYGNTDIYMYDLNTSTETPICTNPADVNMPDISGDRIVWMDFRNENSDIYMYDLNTSTETPICTDPAEQYYPAISADRVIWQDNRNGDWDIYMYDLGTNTETPICTNPADQTDPAISGDRIVWRDHRNGGYDVYMFDLVTGTETPICTDTVIEFSGWGPAISGDKVVWTDIRNSGNYDIYMYQIVEPVNEVSVNFHTAWTYNPSGDTFTNDEVTGSKSWHTHIGNIPDETGAEVVALALSLDSELEFYPYQGENLVTLGPPTYEWFFGNVAEGAGEDDTHVGFTIPDVFPVTFTPGFDASRVADKTEFLQSEGTQTQNLTITMTPWEVTEGFNISVAVYEDGLVDAVINPPTGEDDFDLSPDGHWLDIWPRDLEIGTTYTYNVTIEVTPQVPGVEFMPMVHVKCYESSLAYGTTSGSSVSYPAGDPADEIGTWTWSAEGSYEWHWDEGVNRCVGWRQHCWENYLFAHFKSSYSYTPPGDSFTNGEVTGSRGWDTHIQNRLYATGETLTNVSLSLDSDLTFDHIFGSENLVTTGPPTYEWSFPEIPVGLLENVGVAFESSTWPVTYAPGFDASRMVDVTEFEGPSTQTITITVTPREAMDTIGMNVIATKEDWVNPVITSCRLEDSTDGSAGDNFRFNIFPDGHQLSMWQKEPVVDNEYTYIVTIEVTPKASKVEFLPFVGVQNMPNHPITPADTGSLATYTVDGIGTWTWSTGGSYSWGVATGEPFLAVEWGPRSSDLTNYISVTFNNAWMTLFAFAEDTFLNQEVTGSKSSWHTNMDNMPDGSGEPVNGVTLSLWSPLALDLVLQENLTEMGPPTYGWFFGEMPEGSIANVYVGCSPDNPSSMPVTFTPGFDATRVFDRTYFWQSEGTQTQTLTITMTPREEVPRLETHVVISPNDLVDAVITSPTGGEGVHLEPDGRTLHLRVEDPAVDTTYTFTVTIEVTPHVPYVEFTPLVDITRVASMSAHVVTGDSLSYTVYDMGTWTWNTEGDYDYSWHWTEMITYSLFCPQRVIDLTNNVSWEYITWWSYTPAEDTFTNSEVTGRTWWQANVDNRGDATGEPITGLELMLNSELALDWNPVCLVDVTPISEEPPTYQWSFSDVAEQDTAGVWVKPENPDQFPATFTPGFDATRSADITQFLQSDGTQTQTLTIEVTPQEVTEWLIIFVAADENLLGIPIDENDLVEAVITAPPSGADLIPDGHLMIMQVPAGEVGVPTTFTITIEVTPKVPRVEYMPVVWVATPDELIGSGPFSGSSHSRTVDLLGTWTWNATGDYAGSWAEAVFGAVTFPAIQSGIEDFAIKSMFIDFDRRPRLDEIAVTKATFSLREGATYDLAVDDVIVSVDGVEIVIPAGSFRKMGLLGGEKYIYNSPRGVKPKILMVLNFDDGEWSLLAHDIDASAVNNYDGVDVAFSIGYMSAIENVNMRLGGLSYIAED